MGNDNLKKSGQLRNVWVELGFGTVCTAACVTRKGDKIGDQSVAWSSYDDDGDNDAGITMLD